MKLGITRPPELKDTNPKDAVANNKVPLHLLSPIAAAHWAVAQVAGLLKYGAWNWRKAGVKSSVYIGAIRRHCDAYESGEEYDEDGTHNLGAIMASAGILLDARAAGKLTDDRPPSVDVRPTYAELEVQIARLREKYKDKNPRHYTIADTEAVHVPMYNPTGSDAAYEIPAKPLDAWDIDLSDEGLDEDDSNSDAWATRKCGAV